MASGRSARLVGRDAELGRLRALAAEAASGVARVALVRGEPGIGKTRLVGELLDELRADGALVLSAQGLQLAGGELAFGVGSGLVRSLARQVGLDDVRRLAGSQAAALGTLHPGLAADEAGSGRAGVFSAMDTVVAGLAADRLVCLVVDDLQWADGSSRELVRFLAQSCAEVPLLVVATVRTTAADVAEASPDVAALARVPGTLDLTLHPLTTDEIAEQLAEVVGGPPDPMLLDRVLRSSDGVPLYVEELAAGGAALSLDARLAGLAPDSRALLRAAAVAEGRADLGLVARVSGLDPERADAAYREAVDRGILEASREGLVRFRHGLLREGVLDRSEPLALRRLHAAWAEVVPELDGGLISESGAATARAAHLVGTGDVAAALPATIRAALAARRDGAWAETVAWWQRALDLWTPAVDLDEVGGMRRAQVAVALTNARQHIPRPEGLGPDRAMLEQVLRDLPEDAWLDRLLLQESLGVMDIVSGHVHRWSRDEAPEAVIARVADALPDRTAAQVLQVLAMAHGHLITEEQWNALVEASRAAVPDDGGYQLSATLVNRGYSLLRAGDEEGTLALVREMTDAPEVRPYLATMLVILAFFLNSFGHVRETVRMVESVVDVDHLGPAGARLWGYTLENYAWATYWSGSWERCARVADLLAWAPMDPASAVTASTIRAAVAVRRGDPGPLADVEAALQGDDPDLQTIVTSGPARVLLAEVAGDWGRVLELLTAADFGEHADGSLEVVLRAAQLLLRTERTPERVDAVRDALARVRPMGRFAPAVHGEVETVLDGPADPARWADVVSAWDEIGTAWDAAHARLWWARALAGAGDRRAAADVVRRALEITDALGAVPLADQLRELDRSARLQVGADERVAQPAGLTEREAEVLALVGRGLTNAEIGGRLYMSPKTASVHVSRLIAKLGVANRTEAAAHAQRLGLVAD